MLEILTKGTKMEITLTLDSTPLLFVAVTVLISMLAIPLYVYIKEIHLPKDL